MYQPEQQAPLVIPSPEIWALIERIDHAKVLRIEIEVGAGLGDDELLVLGAHGTGPGTPLSDLVTVTEKWMSAAATGTSATSEVIDHLVALAVDQ